MFKVLRHHTVNSEAAGTFVADQRGSVAVIFALVALPVVAVLALAIDYGRASHTQTTIQNAVDAAAGSAIRLTLADTKTIRNSFEANLRANLPEGHKETPFELVIDKDRGTVQASVATKVATSLLGIVGIPALDIRAEATRKFATHETDSKAGENWSGMPAEPTSPSSASGLGVKRPPRELPPEALEQLRALMGNLDEAALRQRAVEAEAQLRELIARNPNLLRRP